MRKISIAIFAFMLFAGVLSAQESREYTKQYGVYSDEWAKEVIGFMADEKFNGREAGTKENHKIMKFIAKEFKKMGLKPEIQEITSESLTAAIGEPRKGKVYPAKMNNVIARIEGKNPNMQVVVGAHYDHLGNKPGIGIHPGADDNASGIVALLS
ncbi:MAG: M28 family peptidase, partial [Bacteroidales bacterium]|nr:M28 family peptidase [Bacteroidales bacterium]